MPFLMGPSIFHRGGGELPHPPNAWSLLPRLPGVLRPRRDPQSPSSPSRLVGTDPGFTQCGSIRIDGEQEKRAVLLQAARYCGESDSSIRAGLIWRARVAEGGTAAPGGHCAVVARCCHRSSSVLCLCTACSPDRLWDLGLGAAGREGWTGSPPELRGWKIICSVPRVARPIMAVGGG